jgi:very-short-patch-repair endonuclease
MYPYNESLTEFAKELRKNMTPEERHLWYDFLKFLPMTVKRQYIVGNYILDFFIPSTNIAIEIDGSQHSEIKGKKADEIRDRDLSEVGIKVIRYTNSQVNKQFDGVISNIMKNIGIDYSELKKHG